MRDDVRAEIARLGEKGIVCAPVSDEGFGLLTAIRLPGGGDLGLDLSRGVTRWAHGTAG